MEDTNKAPEHSQLDIEEADPKGEMHGENLNVRAAIIHMIGDAIQSAGVIIAAIIIYCKPDWTIADPICTFLFSILVLFTTVPIFCDCMRILMEASPEDVEIVEVLNDLNNVSVSRRHKIGVSLRFRWRLTTLPSSRSFPRAFS